MGFPDRRIKIITLIENTQGHPECRAEHGLSFYIEMGSAGSLWTQAPAMRF